MNAPTGRLWDYRALRRSGDLRGVERHGDRVRVSWNAVSAMKIFLVFAVDSLL